VSSDPGLWHCVTGYRPAAAFSAGTGARGDLRGTGMGARVADAAGGRQELDECGADGHVWHIHAFHFATDTADVRLNWGT